MLWNSDVTCSPSRCSTLESVKYQQYYVQCCNVVQDESGDGSNEPFEDQRCYSFMRGVVAIIKMLRHSSFGRSPNMSSFGIATHQSMVSDPSIETGPNVR